MYRFTILLIQYNNRTHKKNKNIKKEEERQKERKKEERKKERKKERRYPPPKYHQF
jgi:hypothetical protein